MSSVQDMTLTTWQTLRQVRHQGAMSHLYVVEMYLHALDIHYPLPFPLIPPNVQDGCSGHHYSFYQCLCQCGPVNKFTFNVLSINASVPTFKGLFRTYNHCSNSSMSVDGVCPNPSRYVQDSGSSQNFPFCICNLTSSLPISNFAKHQCTVHHFIVYCHFGLPAWLIIPKGSVPKASTAVTALPTLLSNNASSIPHAHLTLPISDVVYLTCFYTQLVQIFSLLNNLVLGNRAHMQTLFIQACPVMHTCPLLVVQALCLAYYCMTLCLSTSVSTLTSTNSSSAYTYHRTTVSTRNSVPLTGATAPSLAQTSHHTIGSYFLLISSITLNLYFTCCLCSNC